MVEEGECAEAALPSLPGWQHWDETQVTSGSGRRAAADRKQHAVYTEWEAWSSQQGKLPWILGMTSQPGPELCSSLGPCCVFHVCLGVGVGQRSLPAQEAPAMGRVLWLHVDRCLKLECWVVVARERSMQMAFANSCPWACQPACGGEDVGLHVHAEAWGRGAGADACGGCGINERNSGKAWAAK